MKRKYLVTGGTGFLGRSLVRSLMQAKHQVRILDDNSRGQLEQLKDIQREVECIQGDIRDLDTVKKACQGMDSVCHLAFVNGTEFFYKKPDLVLDVGVRGMINVLDACKTSGVKELLLMSSSEVYQHPQTIPTDETAPLIVPDPLNPRYSYGGGKLISELMALHWGAAFLNRVLIVRPHNVYGPAMGWEHVIPQFIVRLKRAIEKKSSVGKLAFPIQGTGKETRSFVFIDDFTDGVMKVLEKGAHRNIYHVGTMDERSIQSVVGEIANYFSVNVEIIPRTLTQGSTPRRCPDIKKLEALGYQPKTSFAQGIAASAKWYSEHTHLAPK